MSVQVCACEPTSNHKLKRKFQICQAERLSGCRQSFFAAFDAILFVCQWVRVLLLLLSYSKAFLLIKTPWRGHQPDIMFVLYANDLNRHTHAGTCVVVCVSVCVRLLLIVLKFLSPNQFGLLCHLQMAHCLPVFFQHGFLFIFVFFLMRKLLAAA